MTALDITLRFRGRTTDGHAIDFYDVSQALIGFQRSLALTTHLILNDEIITQAPALKNAEIFAFPPQSGSWEITAGVILAATAGAIYKLGTAPKDTPIGHVIRSAYDYLLLTTLGVHVDYDKTIGQQMEEAKQQDSSIKILPPSRFESLAEKCETAVRELHRPIYKSGTAEEAQLISVLGADTRPVGPTLNQETYEYIAYTETTETAKEFSGKISSYNINTFKGRVYVQEFGRPIPFELAPSARDSISVGKVTQSLDANAQRRNDDDIWFSAFEHHSRSGRLKGFYIVEILSSLDN